ncbi:MAG: phosphoribosylglycinamide formyltransferase [Phycisphaeraceae bacterium]|nr:phosphoribosylglycinamide formyltransferase [Phycisphaeraceae bacterium]
MTARLAVMLSGSGRTLLNLVECIRAGRLHAEIALVIASRECLGAERARQAGIETVVLKGEIPRDVLQHTLTQHRIDWVVLAGYLKRIAIPPAYRGRIVNIHPSLLPEFGGHGMYGHHVHEAVLRAGRDRSGCTVHLVDDEYDRGPILLQKSCPVLPGDTPDTLAARVFELECRAYPEALERLLASGVSPMAGPRKGENR